MEKLTSRQNKTSFLEPVDAFLPRHIGPDAEEIDAMLAEVGFDTLDALTSAVIPKSIQLSSELQLEKPMGERAALEALRGIAARNELRRSYIGMGYHDCVTPPVILRNVFENPGWYTQYTPYQAELAQGRLEALLNFQTMVSDLTGLPLANASLLDEGTAAAEAMTMCRALVRPARNVFFVADDCHPQTIAVVRARALPLGIEVRVGDPAAPNLDFTELFGILLQYPSTEGRLCDHGPVIDAAHAASAIAVVACDLLALTLLRAPGEFGADIAVGSSQRFGVPLGYGGPHAAFLATHDRYKRQIPGRIVGVSKDDTGRPALRLALQTREQHIRRDKATSNICTAQALLAILSSMYAVYHGPEGLRRIARRVHGMALTLAVALRRMGFEIDEAPFFDTFAVRTPDGGAGAVHARADVSRINLRDLGPDAVGVSLDETTTTRDLRELLEVVSGTPAPFSIEAVADEIDLDFPEPFARRSAFLEQEVFSRYHSEHEMLRYLQRLQSRELSLAHSMIPLGSCTMKLNATSEMIPVTWSEFGALHPFVPLEQARGYAELFRQLESWLCEITGFHAASLQPNAGAQGEYAGLSVIRAWHERNGEVNRNVCLIPTSAHGTNPASAVMTGMHVVLVRCLDDGSIDLDDLRMKAEAHRESLAALMITYPSTHGVFEDTVGEVCRIVHDHGGQVYLDGANMNAQIGLCRPGDFGADVCHLNLHKTFCIPHGGGGPGMGPIAVAEHLAPFLPGHPLFDVGGESAIGPVASAPFGSSSILPISWTYIAMMGAEGLRKASQVAVLNANYMARRIGEHYPVVYRGRGGLVAHEFIIDLRPLKDSTGIGSDDVAKRLMDFGFHAPTMSWPVAGTLMIEPTESESRGELDRFCDAMRIIRDEIRDIEEGRSDREDNPLRRAPHTAEAVACDTWDRGYTREQAAFPAPWVRERKFWPPVGRIDNVWGDRNLVCTCEPVESYGSPAAADPSVN